MADDGPNPGSFDDIFDVIEELYAKLTGHIKLTTKQRAQIEALLAYYLALTRQLKAQINYSLVSGESLTPGDGTQVVTGFSLTPGDHGKKHKP